MRLQHTFMMSAVKFIVFVFLIVSVWQTSCSKLRLGSTCKSKKVVILRGRYGNLVVCHQNVVKRFYRRALIRNKPCPKTGIFPSKESSTEFLYCTRNGNRIGYSTNAPPLTHTRTHLAAFHWIYDYDWEWY
ncbi:uncharacterized protein LOC130625574 [Hydractinia symbiolongicarpus]|uniref:uncharacterized protein LOC130625574 n=1 Tax=Hydractinia symbiolongicarpus TaxID=13093 RepID=UPI00255198B3|nr:uncharacterized protein LOC130625574 [Hydractinia symbiolongicarpus]